MLPSFLFLIKKTDFIDEREDRYRRAEARSHHKEGVSEDEVQNSRS